jgi:pyruvate formate lyase activating enzyme
MYLEPIMPGKIHSFESTSFVDGPGARCVIFFQGCSLGCRYCHNPDTWNFTGGQEATAEELIEKVKRYKPYFTSNGGGLTCSGGEPLSQPEFLLEILTLAKAAGIHTAIDTSGFGNGRYDELLAVTDLVMLDLKHVEQEGVQDICSIGDVLQLRTFEAALNNSKSKVWVRHVVIPGTTDSVGHLRKVYEIALGFKNLEKIELLPYHTMGVMKYRELGIRYPYEHLPPMNKALLEELKDTLKYHARYF